jgi:hypothetical protein
MMKKLPMHLRTKCSVDLVFNRFGVPIEVLIDQVTKFRGEFQKLCEKALINHQITSQNHPKANELTKRMV